MIGRRFALFLAGTSVLLSSCMSNPISQRAETAETLVITDDIERFWLAYDLIIAENDTREQARLFNRLYLDRGTPGLHAMMRARSYRTAEFIQAINEAPAYWNAMRANTLDAELYAPAIEDGLARMRELYPANQAVPVYFVIGALRSGGTAIDGKLLIGAELAMADDTVPASELMARFPHLADYFEGNPRDNIVALNLHEWVHTQQRSEGGADLLSQALFEGVAEYVSTTAIGVPSSQPSIVFGLANSERVITRFANEIGSEDFSQWIWNDAQNEFGVRDLGYFVGFAIAKAYVEQGVDPDPITTLFELDYTDLDAVDRVVDSSGLFPQQVALYRRDYVQD